MARTQTLQEMVSNLRAEAGHSLAVSQGVNTEQTLKYILKRTQEELWAAFVWPEMAIRDDRPMVANQHLYDYSINLKFDAIREAWSAQPGAVAWSPVNYGISEDKIVPGTPAVNTTSSDPVRFWEADGTKFRVWPTPVNGGWLRFKGNRELSPFVANSDSCSLDATAVILFAASELLARSKAEDAANKLQKAQRHLVKLLGGQVSAKNKISTYGTSPADGGANITMRHLNINYGN
jgi:hypothetical protein